MYEIPGEVRMGEQYEEFYTDETGFYEMILKIFYKEVAWQGEYLCKITVFWLGIVYICENLYVEKAHECSSKYNFLQ